VRLPRPLVAGLTAAFVLAACAGDATDGTDGTAPAGDDDPTAAGATGYPVTVTNCGVEVVFESAPQRIALLNAAALPALDALDLLDRVVTRAGAFPSEYYAADVIATLDDIPSIGGDDIDASGHFQISQEAIIAAEPDLVMGLPDGIAREGLADAGIAVLVEPVSCPEGVPFPTFDDVASQLRIYGEVFDQPAEAEAAIAGLDERLGALAVDGEPTRTAAVLYPTVGGGAGYAYGTRSMAHPQLESAGFTNAFADVDERVFEVTLEELLARDPDALILLHVDGDPGPVEAEIRNLPGADELTAVREDAIHVQLFNFTEPPTLLSVDGLERILDALGDDA